MHNDETDVKEFAREYFAAAIDPDQEHYIALFSETAIVHDDGRTYRGTADVRRWRSEVPPVRYELREASGGRASCLAVAEVSGEFPGSPVALRFSFERDEQGLITALDIAPGIAA